MIETTGGISPNAVYTLREACQFLKISEATARRWLKQGRLRGGKIGRDYRFLGRNLLDCLEATPATPGEETPLLFFGPDHPLLKLAGIGESGLSEVSEEHDRYLTESIRDES